MSEDGRRHAIRYLDFESGHIQDLATEEGDFARDWLAVSPDEKWILYTQFPPWTSELMLVENLH